MFRATLAGGRRERFATHERIRGGAFAPARIAPGARNPDPTAPGVAGRIATRCALPGAGTDSDLRPPVATFAQRRLGLGRHRARDLLPGGWADVGLGTVERTDVVRDPDPGLREVVRRVRAKRPEDVTLGQALEHLGALRARLAEEPDEGGRPATPGRAPSGPPRGPTGQAGRFVEVAVPAIPVRAPEEPPPVRAVAPGSRRDRIVGRTEASVRSVERAGPEAFEGADGSPRIRVAVVVRWPGPRPRPGGGASGPCRPCRRFRGSTDLSLRSVVNGLE